MIKKWQEIKREIEQYCGRRCTKTGVAYTFSKRNIIHHLKVEKNNHKDAMHALVSLQKDGKVVKYGAHAYRWNAI